MAVTEVAYAIPELADKLRARSVLTAGGCWVWQGAKAGKGYAQVSWNGHKYGHRLAFEARTGRPPLPGLVVDHVECDNPPCVNPEHVDERTNQFNVARGKSGQRSPICHLGHPKDRVTPKGQAYCSTCVRASNQKRASRARH